MPRPTADLTVNVPPPRRRPSRLWASGQGRQGRQGLLALVLAAAALLLPWIKVRPASAALEHSPAGKPVIEQPPFSVPKVPSTPTPPPPDLPPAPTAADLAPDAANQPRGEIYVLPKARVYYSGTTTQADAYAKATHRLLVVDLRADCHAHYEHTGMRTQPFEHRSVAAWILQHAILVKATRGEASIIKDRLGQLADFDVQGFCLAVFRGNQVIWPTPVGSAMDIIGGIPIRRFYTPIDVLFAIETARERAAARDPVWDALHHRDNPPINAPDRGPLLHTIESENAAKIEPLPTQSEFERSVGTRPDVLGRMLEAVSQRTSVHRAAGLWTWAMELGVELDPDAEPALLSVGIAEMTELARASSQAREQFRLIRDASCPMLPWSDFPGMFRWASLNACVGERAATVLQLDERVGDVDEQAMLPVPWKQAYELMASRLDAITLRETPEKALRWLKGQAEILAKGGKKSEKVGEGGAKNGAEDLAALRAWLFEVESCRAYCKFRSAGNDASAEQVAEVLIATRGIQSRRKLAIAAALARVSKPEMAEWLEAGDPVRNYLGK